MLLLLKVCLYTQTIPIIDHKIHTYNKLNKYNFKLLSKPQYVKVSYLILHARWSLRKSAKNNYILPPDTFNSQYFLYMEIGNFLHHLLIRHYLISFYSSHPSSFLSLPISSPLIFCDTTHHHITTLSNKNLSKYILKCIHMTAGWIKCTTFSQYFPSTLKGFLDTR